MMITAHHPWGRLYPDHVTHEVSLPHGTLHEAWLARVAHDPDGPAFRYFDTVYSAQSVNETADALALGFAGLGVGAGDVVGIQLQNIPQFPLVELALWRLGAIPLVLNPMYKAHELSFILNDAKPVGIVGLSGVVDEMMRQLGDIAPSWVLTTREYEVVGRHDRSPGELGRPMPGELADNDMYRLIEAHRGETVQPASVEAESPALLTYTSGTTGGPKGALGSHRSLLASAETTRQWSNVQPRERVIAVAPLFHITGAVATGISGLVSGAELVFIGRVTPQLLLEAIGDYEVHHFSAAITAFNGLLALPEGGPEDLRSLLTVFSGGAPVPPKTVERFAERYGYYIRNAFGMTETAAACIAVPLTHEAPVETETGTLSVGIPMPEVQVRVRDDAGELVPAGSLGELEVSGPGLMTAYLNQPEATAATLSDGWLKTGDVAIVDEAGWVYLVDRKKDQINVSGYKVWPREVEDALYEYPGVREAAVVGRPNSYSGEEVVAFVSLQPGSDTQPDDIREHVRAKLANYKAPREVMVLEDLPKTATGKIRRHTLSEREAHASGE